MKYAIVNNIPTPYRRQLFSLINSESNDHRLDVFYLSKSESVRDWSEENLNDYETILPVLVQYRNRKTTTSDVIVNSNFIGKLISYDVVVCCGYNYPTYLIIATMRKLLKKKTILFCESTASDSRTRKAVISAKKLLLKLLFDKFIVPGKASRDYLQSLNVPNQRIYDAYNASSLVPEKPLSLVCEKSLRLLYVGRLSVEKNLHFVLKSLLKSQLDFTFTIVGNGPQLANLKEIVKNDTRILFLSHCNQSELREVYASHDVLLLASNSEPWGLVVNEAVNFGLAVIVSDKVGCRHELVNGNGFVFKNNSEEDFLSKLDLTCNNIFQLRKKSVELSQRFSIENQSTMFWKAMNGSVQ